MLAIYKKELRAYFKSFFGWLFIAAFCFFSGFFFVANNLLYGSPLISNTLDGLSVVTLFVLPLLTMRMFSDEKKQKTEQLILTAPVRLSSVIAGKFLAVATLMVISLFVIVIEALILTIYGPVSLVQTVLAILGFFLFGCICISIGLFMSSVTEHQFIAAVLTYGVYIFLWLGTSFGQFLFRSNELICNIFKAISIFNVVDNLFEGIFSIIDVFYAISVVMIMLMLSWRVFGKNSWKASGESKKKFWMSIGIPAIAIIVIIAANVGIRQIPVTYTEFDCTTVGRYSLTDTTKELAKNLEEDITIYVLGDEKNLDKAEKVYLDKYAASSKHIIVEYRPFETYPSFAGAYTDEQLSAGSLIVMKGDQYKVISYNDLYETTINYSTYSQEITGIDIEGQVTSAISSLLNNEVYKICYTEGHAEIPLSNSLISRIKKGGFECSSLALVMSDIPAECQTLVVNSPQSDFSEAEIKKMEEYVNQGGKLILVASYPEFETPRFDAFMSEYGATLSKEVAFERNVENVYMNSPYYLLLSPESHAVTTAVSNAKKVSFFSVPRVFFLGEESEDYSLEPLYMTSEMAYIKELDANSSIEYMDGDETGSFVTAVYIVRYNENGTTAKIVEIGSAEYLVEDCDSIVSNANTDTFMGAVSTITEKSVSSSVPAKSISYDPIVVSTGFAFLYSALFIIIIPFGLLAAGIVIIVIRRKK